VRLSSYLKQAASLRDLKLKYPDLEKELETARAKGVGDKYFHWIANQRDAGADLDKLIGLVEVFEKALSTKFLDKLIGEGKLPPQAKDIGWWNKPTVEVPNRGEVPTLEVMQALSPQEVKTPESGIHKIYDDGRIVVYVPKDYKEFKRLARGKRWLSFLSQEDFD